MAKKTISLMNAEAYDAFVSSLADGTGAYHPRCPSDIEALSLSEAINFMEGEVGADDAGAIIEVDEDGTVRRVEFYPAYRLFMIFD